jgi:cytochrome c-type biogenesis protein CcmH/NrfG
MEFAVLIIAALIVAAAAAWVLRAYRRASGGDKARAWPVFAACAVVGVCALGLYLAIGRPDLPGASSAARLEALKERDPTTYSLDEALAILHEAARDHPTDAAPLIFSGTLLFNNGRPQEAARAFDAALRRDPRSSEAMLGLGRAMFQIDEGRLSPQTLQLFQAAAAVSPSDPVPWLYQAMAAMLEDRADDARRLWGEALSRMAPDDPRREMATRMSAGQ